MKSPMAEPSRRNSGQLTTENGIGEGCDFLTISAVQSPVPTGTVDLLMIISGFFMCSAMLCDAARTYFRSASPSTADGVPTQTNTYSALASPSVYEVLN